MDKQSESDEISDAYAFISDITSDGSHIAYGGISVAYSIAFASLIQSRINDSDFGSWEAMV